MNITKIFTVISVLLMSSCSKWIDVKPTDRLAESVLFQTKEGYLKALNGIYIEMSHPSLYGQFLTAGQLDAMAQYYMSTSSTQPYYYYMTYDYTQSITKAGFELAWQRAYATIANINVLMENIPDSPNSILPEPYYGLVKGEALALRAYLHLDMLRLFGPIYTTETKDVPTIPYYRDANRDISPLYTAEKITEFLLNDLNEAKELLATTDPIRTSGSKDAAPSEGKEGNAFALRQYRLNYYAVQALLARTYLWKGDNQRAWEVATQTIDAIGQADQNIFPFVTHAAATNGDNPDRLFETEVFFAIYSLNRTQMYNNLFSSAQIIPNRLAPNPGNTNMSRVEAMYDDKNDYRYKIWNTETLIGVPLVTNQKYKDHDNYSARYMIPLIRLSELYLTAAECAGSVEQASAFINELRANRGAFQLTLSDYTALQNAITNEHRREFIGEGQQFYYYKRRAFTSIPNHASLTSTKLMSINSYHVPLPDSETALRNTDER